MNKKKSIGFKFLCIISTILVVFFCITLCIFWTGSNVEMKKMLEDKAELALQFDLAVRSYVSESVRPFAQEHAEKDAFIPEVMSTSYVARSVFDKVRNERPDYTIKFSSDNPRNRQNQAEPEELKIIDYFNNNPEAKRWNGIIEKNGKEHIGLFSARRMKKSCLQCHGVPEDAPASLISKYGDKAGFHRPIGEVIGLDTIAIPVAKYKSEAINQTIQISLVMLAGLTLLLIVVYYAFQQLIGLKLKVISEHFKNVVKQGGNAKIKHLEFDPQSNDEIGVLAKSFNVMVDNLSSSTTSIENLNREIDERKQIEDQLRESEHQLRNIFDTITEAILVFDETGYVVNVNSAALDIYGYEEREMIGLAAKDIVSPKYHERFGELEKQLQDSGRFQSESLHIRKDGSVFDSKVTGRLFLYKGQQHVLVVVSDITEQKKNEEHLRKSFEEIERFNRLMLGRESRVIEMKKEVNALLAELGRAPEYSSVLENEKASLSLDES